MRLSLMRASGRTSYCVTTGPVLVPTTVAGMENERSFSSMMRTFCSWSWRSTSAVSVAGSSSVTAGSCHSFWWIRRRATSAASGCASSFSLW